MHFRQDIQMLRALALLLVLAFHFGIRPFVAGYIGVDIFFVISGYLMVAIQTDGETVRGFYLRRARRLLPAYFATVILTLLAAWWIVMPSEYAQLARQGLFAAGFASNFGFWMQDTYFSKSSFTPLLHLWSLAVEIQFYLIFPLLVASARRWRAALPLIFVLSLAACLVLVTISPKTSFFMMPMRLWQFVAGMMVARLAVAGKDSTRIGLAACIGLLGAALLPLPGDGVGLIAGHPGLLALAVTVLTSAVLWGGLPTWLVTSWPGRMFVRIGNASYTIYLVHLPVIVLFCYRPFAGTLLPADLPGAALPAAVLTAVLAAALHLGVDQRASQLFTTGRACAALATTALLALVLPVLQLYRFPPGERNILTVWEDRAPLRCGKLARVLAPTAKTCDLSTGPRGQILLLGDSYADMIRESFVKVAARHGYGVRFVVSNLPLREPAYDVAWLSSELKRPDLAGTVLHYAASSIDSGLLTRAETALAGHPHVLLLPAPAYRESVPGVLLARIQGEKVPLAALDLGVMRASLAASPMLRIDPSPLFCTPRCQLADRQGHPYYFDSGHLSLTGARLMEPAMEAALAAMEIGSKVPSVQGKPR